MVLSSTTGRRWCRWLAAIGFSAHAWIASAAAGKGTPDPSAIREASARQDSEDQRYASSNAYTHFMRAMLAAHGGDPAAAVSELKLALVFDPEEPFLRVALAEQLERTGNLDRSLAELLAVTRSAPRHAPAHRALGKLWARRGRPRHAIAAFERAVALEPLNPVAYLHLAEAHLAAGDDPRAVAAIEALAKKLPAEPMGFKALGRWYAEKGEVATAERFLLRAEKCAPGDPQVLKLLAGLADLQGRDDEAVALYERALARIPDDAEVLAAMGTLRLERGELEVARAYFDRLLHADPDDASSHARLALAYVKAHRLDEAATLFARARGLSPGDPALAFFHGRVLEERGDWVGAAEAFAAVGESAELFVQARLRRVRCLSAAGAHEAAISEARQALAAEPDGPEQLTSLADALEAAGQERAAMELLQGASERGGAQVHAALSALLIKSGRTADAVALLERSIQRYPESELLRFALAAAFEKRGEFGKAVGQLRAVLVLDPNNPAALNSLGYALAERGVELEEAERLVLKALSFDPENGAFLDSLGWIHFKRGEHHRAAEVLEKAHARLPGEPVVAEHLADAYSCLSRWVEAEAAYRRALDVLGAAGDPELREKLGRKLERAAAAVRESDGAARQLTPRPPGP